MLISLKKIKVLLLCIFMWLSHTVYAVQISNFMETHLIPDVGSIPVVVNLDNIYSNAIPVCTYNLASDTNKPGIVRINDISPSSITISVGLFDDVGIISPGNVHCVIVEEGAHDLNGTAIEARSVLSTGTVGRSFGWNPGNNNNSSGWNTNLLENVTSLVTNTYSNPIVLGQVITANDPEPSAFFANNCSVNRTIRPYQGNNNICVGKHISRENGTRADEMIGIIVINATPNGTTTSNIAFQAGLTSDTIAGVTNNPPYSFAIGNTYNLGIATQLAEDGGDGSWAVLYGANPLAANQINLAVDESLVNNANRNHTNEEVSYLVFSVPTITLNKIVDNTAGGTRTAADFTLTFTGASNTGSGVTGEADITNALVQPGPYTLTESSVAQYAQTGLTCTAGTVTGNSIDLSAFDYTTCTITNTFDPNLPSGVDISGRVFEDLNHNGFFDNLENWTNGTNLFVNLVQSGAVVSTQSLSSGTGNFVFTSVPDGNYDIIITNSALSVTPAAPSGWVFINPNNGTRTLSVAGVPIDTQDFGLFHGSTIQGSVFHDNGVSTPTPGGVANDGTQNGSEVGLTDISIKLTDASTPSIVYAAASTDVNGDYTIYVPFSVPSSNLLITETNLPSYTSTAASVGDTTGTYSINTDSIAFSFTAGNNYSAVNFADVLENTFTNDGLRTTFAGTYASYAHVFTAGSEGAVIFSSSDVSTPTNTGWIETLYQDADCDGVIDAGENEIAAAIALNTGEDVCIIHSQLAPVGASFNDQNEVTITASFAYANSSVVRVYTRTDVTTIGDAVADDLNLVKSVDKTAALPGETLTYTINYSNTKTDPLDNIVITDTTPAFTTFVSATCITPLANNITGCVVSVSPSVGGTGDIEWTLSGSLLSTASGSVEFQVVVDP